MTDTGRIVEYTDENGQVAEIAIDSDVLVTEQRLLGIGVPADVAREYAAYIVDVGINAICPCCEEEAAAGAHAP